MATTEMSTSAYSPYDGDGPYGAEPPRRARQQRPRRGFFSTLVGVLGELMITVGVLLGLFVVWQLWWTDVEAQGHQADVITDMREELFTPPPKQSAEIRTDPPPIPTTSVGLDGDAFAILHVPRWGDDYEFAVAEGVGLTNVLNQGYIGHYPETAMPGEVGNFATAAHRQSYGRPFYGVEELQEGDSLIVETADAYLVYRVTSDEIVDPSQVEVIAPVPNEPGAVPEERMITLTTCHPLFSNAQRWVTYGVLDHWVDKSDGMPAELIEEGA